MIESAFGSVDHHLARYEFLSLGAARRARRVVRNAALRQRFRAWAKDAQVGRCSPRGRTEGRLQYEPPKLLFGDAAAGVPGR
jgi:hypothetical protein